MRQQNTRKIDFSDNPEWTRQDFARARHATPKELALFRKAYIRTFGHPPPRRGPMHKLPSERYIPTYIKLHPKIVQWARAEAKRRGIGYQTVINETLLRRAA